MSIAAHTVASVRVCECGVRGRGLNTVTGALPELFSASKIKLDCKLKNVILILNNVQIRQ